MNYPQHEKLAEVRDQSQAIGEFLEWLAGPPHGILLAKRHKHNRHCYEDGGWPVCGYTEAMLQPAAIRFEKLIAEFFEIDYQAFQKEKDAILAEIRAKA